VKRYSKRSTIWGGFKLPSVNENAVRGSAMAASSLWGLGPKEQREGMGPGGPRGGANHRIGQKLCELRAEEEWKRRAIRLNRTVGLKVH